MLESLAAIALGLAIAEDEDPEEGSLAEERFQWLMAMGERYQAFYELLKPLDLEDVVRFVNEIAAHTIKADSLDELAARYRIYSTAHTVGWELITVNTDAHPLDLSPQDLREMMFLVDNPLFTSSDTGSKWTVLRAPKFGPVPEDARQRVSNLEGYSDKTLLWVLSWDKERVLVRHRSEVRKATTVWDEDIKFFRIEEVLFVGTALDAVSNPLRN